MKNIVTDLTYVNIADKWFYICFIIDLFNREIIGYSSGSNKTVDLVHQALATIEGDLHNVENFHSDRGKEFGNHTIDELLAIFDIERSLSHKGGPYNNVNWWNKHRIHGSLGYVNPMDYKHAWTKRQ